MWSGLPTLTISSAPNKLACGCGWDVVGTCGLGEQEAVPLQSYSLQRPTVLVIGEVEGLFVHWNDCVGMFEFVVCQMISKATRVKVSDPVF